MTKVARNSPCPCGSGKKYKKCCWGREQAATVQAALDQANRSPTTTAAFPGGLSWEDEYYDDGLDERSNRIVDLINAGDYEAARAGCADLQEKFPDVIDWIDRTAMLHEAKGEIGLAIDYYQRCLDFIAPSPDNDETIFFYQGAIARLRKDRTSKPTGLRDNPKT